LKFHGTYQQDDRDARKHRQPGDDKSYSVMIRLKVPGGKITAEQLLTELSLGERLGSGTLRITTRQGFQLNGVVKGNLWATIHESNAALLTTLAACGDLSRNVMCCPAPHHNDGVHDRLQATADAIARPEDNCIDVYTQEIGLLASFLVEDAGIPTSSQCYAATTCEFQLLRTVPIHGDG
jgi:sulfite reductase (ferredoxin)